MSLWNERTPRLTAAGNGVFDTWEILPEERRQELRARYLADYVSFARELGFYRDRLQGFDAKSSHPLKNVPVLHSSDLRGLVPPVSKDLVTGGVTDYTVFQSGGTTGTPKS